MRDVAEHCIAVGFFDGVHLGHQAILRGAEFALTFRNHPLALIAPERAPRLIMSCEDRANAIRALGVKVVLLDFDTELARYTPERFLGLLEALASQQCPDSSAPLRVRCGTTWRFGKNASGDADWLRQHGVGVEVVPSVGYAGEAISSTRIRSALEAGRIVDANAMLGRPFVLRGCRFAGKGAGRELGFPTLNVDVCVNDATVCVGLPRGVYVVEVCGVRALANYGVAPTFVGRAWDAPVFELHVPGGTGRELKGFTDGVTPISILRFVRPERKFDSISELRLQLAADCAKIDV